jgi:hypothetical protein
MKLNEGNSSDKVYQEEEVSKSILTRLTLQMFKA